MLQFFVRIFAVLGFAATLLVLVSVLVVVHSITYTPRAPKNMVLLLDFTQPIVDQSQSSPFDLAFHQDATPMLDIIRAIDMAKTDGHVKGIIARFGSTQPTLVQDQEIRDAIMRFRTSGKFTYAFSSSYGDFGHGNHAYYLASTFEHIWLQPVGTVGLTGVGGEAPFAKTALGKLGVSGEFMQRKEYKSVMETFTRDDFSEPARDEMKGMIENIVGQIAAGVAENRKMDLHRVDQLIARGPYTADEALKANLITKIGYNDELDAEIKKIAGTDNKQVDVEEYLSYPGKEIKPKATVALIYGSGIITDEDGGPANIAGDDVMSADTISQAFDDAADDKDVRAIIFRIDSPGGSPVASETIRRALVHAQLVHKPVFVSMGSVGASGGYWIAMNADYIAAEPATLTGSIGVVAGKFVTGELWKKIGINWEEFATSDNAKMWSMLNGFTPEGQERMNALLDDTYDAFVKNVSEARKIPMDKMPDVAKGRVWTGAQAVKNGLIDELGGFDVAWAAMEKKLELKATDGVVIKVFPQPETAAEKILKFLKGVGSESASVHVALSQWQHLQSYAQPLLSEIGLDPVSARLSPAIIGVVH